LYPAAGFADFGSRVKLFCAVFLVWMKNSSPFPFFSNVLFPYLD